MKQHTKIGSYLFAGLASAARIKCQDGLTLHNSNPYPYLNEPHVLDNREREAR